MSDQNQYGNYMAQQPQRTNSNVNENSNGSYHTAFGNSQASTDYEGQQQVMYGEYAEQSQQREDEYRSYEEYGAHEYYAGSGEKLRPLPLPPRRRGRGWIWYLLIPATIIMMVLGFAFHSEPGFHSGPYIAHYHGWMGRGFDKGDTTSQTINLPSGVTPNLVINDPNGSVVIRSNGDNNVITVTVPSNDGHMQNIPVNFDQQHDVLFIDMSSFSDGADVIVTTPTHTDVQVQDGSGDVQLQGIDGQVKLTSQDGDIDLSQVALSGQSSVKTQSGSIDFNGSLSPQGNYDFEAADGDVHLTLPSDATFHLVNTPDNLHNDFNGSDVGSLPHPSLNVSSQGGDIIISHGS